MQLLVLAVGFSLFAAHGCQSSGCEEEDDCVDPGLLLEFSLISNNGRGFAGPIRWTARVGESVVDDVTCGLGGDEWPDQCRHDVATYVPNLPEIPPASTLVVVAKDADGTTLGEVSLTPEEIDQMIEPVICGCGGASIAIQSPFGGV